MERKKKPSAEERKRWWKENIDNRGYCDEEYEFTPEELREMETAKLMPIEEFAKKMGIKLDDRKNI